MTSLLLRTPWLGAVLAGALTLTPRAASAQDCADSDCEEGYTCQTSEYESCTVSGCPRGEMCPDAEPVCETVEYTTCAPTPCASDADCPDRMACHAQSYYVCTGGMAGSGGACAPDGSCGGPTPVPDEPMCWEEVGENLCTPRHQLPCTVAADCGGGFDCVESRYWICTGGGMAGAGGAPAAGSGAEPPAPMEPSEPGAEPLPPDLEFECHEESTGEFYCQLQDLPCSADADCPAGLECRDNYLYPPCTGMVGAGGAAGDGSSGGEDPPPQGGSYECPQPVIEQRCMPPEYYGGGGMGPFPGTGGYPGGEGEAGAGDPGDSTGGGSAGTGTAPPGMGSGPSAGSGGSGGGGGADGEESGDSEDDDDGPRGLGWLLSGCSANGPITADPLGWITFGLLALALRRRARNVV